MVFNAECINKICIYLYVFGSQCGWQSENRVGELENIKKVNKLYVCFTCQKNKKKPTMVVVMSVTRDSSVHPRVLRISSWFQFDMTFIF